MAPPPKGKSAKSTKSAYELHTVRPATYRLGFPKTLPCLRCDKMRTSTGPSDRCCARCRAQFPDDPQHRILLGGGSVDGDAAA